MGCITSLDCYFQGCNKPPKKEARNPMAYCSGDYTMHGINCQACVHEGFYFMYFDVVAPGATNNNIAFPSAPGLKELFESLPTGYYGVVNATYTLTEHLLVPFIGSQWLDC